MADKSFGKEYRLLSARDFGYLRENSKSLSFSFLRIYYTENRLKSDTTRVGFSVSKKVGKANIRNRLKRIFRDKFRNSDYRCLNKDILFVVSPAILKKIKCRDDAERILLNSFSKAFKKISEING